MVYPESQYNISIIDKTTDRLGILKLHLSNMSIEVDRFGGNENRTFFVLVETIHKNMYEII